jgi:hypothetical protein
MRHTMTMQPIWVEGREWERPYRREQIIGIGQRIWKLGWGLGFVLLMTALSEWGPTVKYSKVPPVPSVSRPAVHAVK